MSYQIVSPMLRFSLRNLFLALTLIACVIAAIVNHPVVLGISLFLVSPLLFVALMAHFNNEAARNSKSRDSSIDSRRGR